MASNGNDLKTHCRHGHPYDEANTYRRPDGGRGCRQCRAAAVVKYETPRRRLGRVLR